MDRRDVVDMAEHHESAPLHLWFCLRCAGRHGGFLRYGAGPAGDAGSGFAIQGAGRGGVLVVHGLDISFDRAGPGPIRRLLAMEQGHEGGPDDPGRAGSAAQQEAYSGPGLGVRGLAGPVGRQGWLVHLADRGQLSGVGATGLLHRRQQ